MSEGTLRDARLYFLVSLGLAGLCGIAAVRNLSLLGLEFFPLPVGLYVMHRRYGLATGLVAIAAIVGYAATGYADAPVFFALAAAAGIPLGLGLARGWSYGNIVVRMTLAAGLAVAGYLAMSWDRWLFQVSLALDALRVSLEAGAADVSNNSVDYALEAWDWLAVNWQYVGPGLTMGAVLIGACVYVSAATWISRALLRQPGPIGGFRTMRPPDWLVWAVIALAGLWFADRQWPGTGLRGPVWNTAIVLWAVYWLNGLSIAAYWAHRLGVPPLARMLLFVMLMLVGRDGLALVGLFDTWFAFRRLADRFQEARKLRQDAGDDEM